MASGKLLDIQNAADLLGVCESTIRRMVARGEIGYYRVAGRMKFDPDELLNTLRVPAGGAR